MTDFADDPIDVSTLASMFPPSAGTASTPSVPSFSPSSVSSAIRLSDRVRRLVDNAVRAFPVVILVGPPGTGKGVILADLVERVSADPEAFGFSTTHGAAWPDPLRKTPDEGMSLADLVGGWTPDPDHPGGLRWSSGVILDALASDRWVIMDELNRADLDKVLGPLLSWLAGESVELGNLTPSSSAPRLLLEWDPSQASSEVRPLSGLDTADDGSVTSVSFVAGSDFRLLGTFNPQDAHRVFGMGLAIGRRLRTVPIPAIDGPEVLKLLLDRYPELNIGVMERVSWLYAAHLADERTRVGPASFLDMPRYIGVGLAVEGQPLDSATEPLISELIAESYVACVGRFARSLGSTVLADLGARATASGAIEVAQWSWIEGVIVDLA